MDTLTQELKTYKQELPALLKDAGKFALICGDKVEGPYDTYGDAIRVGYKTFGLKSFLVKQIFAQERVQTFTRDIFNISDSSAAAQSLQ